MAEPAEKSHILIVDDDDRLRLLLKKYLSEQGFMATVARDAIDARRKMGWFAFDALVLDVMMPGETGFKFLASLKAPRPPVLMLSAMGEAEDRIQGLEIGAEDYLTKPFEPKELVLRLKSLLRRREHSARIVSFGEYAFDLSVSQLLRAGASVHLTSSESAIFKRLAERLGQPVAREELAKIAGTTNDRSVDVQVTRLRKKIGEEGKPRFLQTVRGAGYVLYASSPPNGGVR